MDSKLSSIVITSILAFALIAGVPAVFENVLAQQDGSGQSGGDAGMDQSGTGMDQSAGNNTGFAQSQPGTTSDQTSSDSDSDSDSDSSSKDSSKDNGDEGEDNGEDGGDNGDEDKEDN